MGRFWEERSRWLNPSIGDHQTTRPRVMAPETEVPEAPLKKPSQELPRSDVAQPTWVGRQVWGL